MSQLSQLVPRKQGILFALFLVLYEFLTYLANDMIMPGMIEVVHQFHAPESAIASSLTAYLLGGASLQIILGPLSDAYGRRPMMLIGAFLFFIFTLLIAATHSMDQFLTARFFQGMGLCFISVIGYATIQELFTEMDAIRLIAIMANAAILAPLLGPLLGAIVIHYTSWQIIFISIAASALIVYWGLWRYMPEPVGRMNPQGKLIAKTPFSLKVIWKNYRDLLKNRSFCLSTLALSILGIPCVAWIALSPIILITEAKLTVIEYGLWQLPVFGATILGNWVLHRLTYKYTLQHIIYLGTGLFILGSGLMALLPYFNGNGYLYLMPGTIIYFFALSILNAPLNRYCLYITPVVKGTASALISLAYMSMGGLGVEIANLFYTNHVNLYFGMYSLVIAVLFFLLIVFSIRGNSPEVTM